MHLVPAQILTTPASKTAEPAREHQHPELSGGMPFSDLIRPQVSTVEETSVESARTYSMLKTDVSSSPQGLTRASIAEKPDRREAENPALPAPPAGTTVNSQWASASPRAAKDPRETGGRPATEVGMDESPEVTSFTISAPSCGSPVPGERFATEVGSDGSSGIAPSPNTAPGGNSIVSGWRPASEAGSGESYEVASFPSSAPQDKDPTASGSIETAPTARQPNQFSGPIASPLVGEHTAFPLKAERFADSSNAVSHGEKKSKTSLSMGHATLHSKTTVASAQSKITSEPASGTGMWTDSCSTTGVPVAMSAVQAERRAVSLGNRKLPTTNLGIGAQPLRPTGGNPSELSISPQLSGSVSASPISGFSGEDMQASPRPGPSSAEIPANTAERHFNMALDKTIGQAELQASSVDSRMHAPTNMSLESNLPAPGVTTVVPAIHATSGIMVTRPPMPHTNSLHMPASATFERMDSAAAPQMIENTPQRLAVGVRNAGLGWVEIRTNRVAGQVSATLSTGSVESHAAVSAQLPPMREYLSAEHVRIDNLASERFSQSSGNREGFSDGQSRNGGGRDTKTPEQAISPRTSSADAEMESMSYINVRV